jgi:tetratricopeptide (TPR) repeat protein
MEGVASARPCRVRGLLLALAVLALGLGPRDAGADQAAATTDAQARSRALFDEARALAEQGRFAEACPLFEASHKLNATGGTALQLANCLERTGELERAHSLYTAIANDPKEENAERVRIARERARALEKRTAKRADVAAPPSRDAGAAPSEPRTEGPSATEVGGWVSLGLGGAALALGAVFGALALSEAAAVKDACVGSVCPTREEANADAATAKGWVANIALPVGVVGVGVGILLLALGGGEAPSAAAARLDASPASRWLVVPF